MLHPITRVDYIEVMKIHCQLLSSPEPLGQFELNLAKAYSGKRGLKWSCSLGARGDKSDIVELLWQLLKISSPRTTGSLLVNPCFKHGLVRGFKLV